MKLELQCWNVSLHFVTHTAYKTGDDDLVVASLVRYGILIIKLMRSVEKESKTGEQTKQWSASTYGFALTAPTPRERTNLIPRELDR